MSLIAFKARNHPQQVVKDAVDDRRTPRPFFDLLNARHSFTVDAAASPENALLSKFWTLDDDAFEQDWSLERVWCNPPYSDVPAWVAKAWTEMEAGCPLVVMLLPANRTEQHWWQDWVEPYRDREGATFGPLGARLDGKVTLGTEFVRGRMRFNRPGWKVPTKGDRPPFGCVILTWEREFLPRLSVEEKV